MRDVTHNPAAARFELAIDGSDDLALAYYRRDEQGRLILTHTEVPSEFAGRGLGSRLARGVFEHARREGLRLVLRCPFMAAWFALHPDYSDVVDG